MGKPSGLTPTFKVIAIRRWMDLVWDAVDEADTVNVTPEAFRAEVRQAWAEVLERKAKHADEILKGG